MKPKQSFLVRLRLARRRAMRSPAQRPVLERLLLDNAANLENLMAAVEEVDSRPNGAHGRALLRGSLDALDRGVE